MLYQTKCDETGVGNSLPCVTAFGVPISKIDLCNTIGKWAVVLALVLSVLPKNKHSQGLP